MRLLAIAPPTLETDGLAEEDMNLPEVPDFDNIFNDINLNDIGDVFEDVFDGLGDIDLLDGLDNLLDNLGDIDILDDLVGRPLFRGNTGDDSIIGSIAGDILIGFLGNDILLGAIGNDIINGGRGSDLLRGLVGSDTLLGDIGRDILEGGGGNDTLVGGQGFDQISGGRGRDEFVLQLRNGIDTVLDFEDQRDRFRLPENIDFDDLRLVQRGRDAVVRVGSSALAVLRDIDIDRLTGADFISFTDG